MESLHAETSEAPDYGSRLRRHWWMVALGALLGLGLALVLTSVQQQVYTSETLVLVEPAGVQQAALAAAGRDAVVNLDNEVQIVRSAAVASAAKDLLRSPAEPAELSDNLSVTVPPNTQVMSMVYEAATPLGAQQGSHAFAQAYLEVRADAATAEIDAQARSLERQIDDITGELQEVSGTVASLPTNSPTRAFAEAQQQVLTGQLTGLNAKLSPLVTAQVDPGSIIDDAMLPTAPARPVLPLNLASGLLLGLLLGVAAALLTRRGGGQNRRDDDVEPAPLAESAPPAETARGQRRPVVTGSTGSTVRRTPGAVAASDQTSPR
ncbi:MAG: Wzz/FepE/Etk N-terminal domain-containing protein [Actinomycetota bacterium]|nr:Wzz/FepE/Etk N-terminal domain-containing protein [Actinomycetota bacterium]